MSTTPSSPSLLKLPVLMAILALMLALLPLLALQSQSSQSQLQLQCSAASLRLGTGGRRRAGAASDAEDEAAAEVAAAAAAGAVAEGDEMYYVTTIAGGDASFDFPYGVAIDGEGNTIVADTVNNRIRRITPEGAVTTIAGSGERGYADGQGTDASFHHPAGVAIDVDGNIIVADFHNKRIRRISKLVPQE